MHFIIWYHKIIITIKIKIFQEIIIKYLHKDFQVMNNWQKIKKNYLLKVKINQNFYKIKKSIKLHHQKFLILIYILIN
jgi:hypothetical protein